MAQQDDAIRRAWRELNPNLIPRQRGVSCPDIGRIYRLLYRSGERPPRPEAKR